MKENSIRKSSGEKRRRERKKGIDREIDEVEKHNTEEHKEAFAGKEEKRASRKIKKTHDTNNVESRTVDHAGNEDRKPREKRRKLGKEKRVPVGAEGGYDKVQNGAKEINGKSKKTRKVKKKDHLSPTNDEKLLDKTEESQQNAVYEMSSGDEDCSRGMKKWITEYHTSRPGLDILQERIDAFIEAHEEQEKKAREEREANAAEGGWTVVVHHKGRKKTTDAESGIAVGSVAQAAVLDNMAKKKKNEVGLDFYRFQKRDAKRSEIMALQSKFEQDKKRIQQLRAARKFRPY